MVFLQKKTLSFSYLLHQGYYIGEMKQAKLFHHWNQQFTSCPSLQPMVGQTQVPKPTLVVATNHTADQT